MRDCSMYNPIIKGTLSPNKKNSYMKDITSLNIIHKVKISFEPPFSSKIADLAQIVRVKEVRETGNSLL